MTLTDRVLARTAPALFVVLWASGFVVARLVRPFVEPESFVSLRFAISACVFAGIAWLFRAPWPSSAQGWLGSLAAGAMMQGGFVGGVFWAVKHGLSPAEAALISGTQPLMTGVLASPLLGERVSGRRWVGILIGFVGAALVLAPDLPTASPAAGSVPLSAVVACGVATLAITLGTILQKRIGGAIDLRSGAALQLLGGLAVTLPAALATEHLHIDNSPDVWIGLAWAVLVLSVAATALLLRLIDGGAVARVTSLFYLVPPFTALMALALFGEALVPVQILGMAVATVGVGLANRG